MSRTQKIIDQVEQNHIIGDSMVALKEMVQAYSEMRLNCARLALLTVDKDKRIDELLQAGNLLVERRRFVETQLSETRKLLELALTGLGYPIQ